MHPTEPALDLRGPAPRVAIAAVRNPFSRSASGDPGDRAPRPMNRAYSMPAYPHLSPIIAEARRCAPLATAVVMPTEPSALASALDAAQSGLVAPILVGRRSSIARAARAPIILTSRAGSVQGRIASCALALLYTRCVAAARNANEPAVHADQLARPRA